MAKFVNFTMGKDAQDIMEKYLDKLPELFDGFDVAKIGFVTTQKKKAKIPIKMHSIRYPHNVWMPQVYVCEIFETVWVHLDQKKKNLSVFKAMCSVADGGFDEQSKTYGKIRKPDIQMYMQEFAATGGIPDWMNNPAAKDPMDYTAKQIKAAIPEVEALPKDDKRTPVTQAVLEEVTEDAGKGKGKGKK